MKPTNPNKRPECGVDCPYCDGHGEFETPGPYAYDESHPYTTVECPECSGDGWVSAVAASRIDTSRTLAQIEKERRDDWLADRCEPWEESGE